MPGAFCGVDDFRSTVEDAVKDVLEQPRVWCCGSKEDHFDPYENVLAEHDEQPVGLLEDTALPHMVGRFEVKVDRGDEPLGIEFEATSCGLMVTAVRAGALRRHNVCCPDSTYMYRQDFIVKVNRSSEVQDMVAVMKREPCIKFHMVHPFRLRLNFDAKSAPLGLQLQAYQAYPQQSTLLEIVGIKEKGAVATFNAHCKAEHAVRVQDFIVSAGGISGDAALMAEELSRRRVLEVELLRVKTLPDQATPEARLHEVVVQHGKASIPASPWRNEKPRLVQVIAQSEELDAELSAVQEEP